MMGKFVFYMRVVLTLLVLAVFAILMLGFTILTVGIFLRKNFVWFLAPCGRVILWFWRLRLEVIPALPVPDRQTVFVFNHTSTIDIFALSALGLPNTRFFLSGFLRKNPMFAILGYLTGIFWTVRQHYPEKRAQIFHNACETLKRTGQSVALSPEGVRVVSGEIGAFNKGAFHLAAALQAPMRPLFIDITGDANPGFGWNAGPGVVRIWVGDVIDTAHWRPEDAAKNKEEVRNMYVDWKNRIEAGAEGPHAKQS
jgi:1-acyl-sn-glycerol-3-phosphate acyltransferase